MSACFSVFLYLLHTSAYFCVFLYLLHTKLQNSLSTSKMKTYIFKNILFIPHIFKSLLRLRFKVGVNIGFRSGLVVIG